MKWLLIIPFVFLVDSTKQNFAEVKGAIIREAQSQRRQEKSQHRQEELDDISLKLDSILIALPDTIK